MTRFDHVAVVGASIGGLLAARVVSSHARHVSVLERDDLPTAPADRRGVPQGRHVHNLLSQGCQVVEELFPGIGAELAAAGAPYVDDLDQLDVELMGHPFLKASRSGPGTYVPTRALLEHLVRRRVEQLPGVTIRRGVDVETPVVAAGRVAGVRLTDRSTGLTEVRPADLVIDASGRSGRTPGWLEAMGLPGPEEEVVEVGIRYVSQRVRPAPGSLPERLRMVLRGPLPERRTGLAAFANEDGLWTVTVFGYAGEHPDLSRAALTGLVRELTPPDVGAALVAATPVSEVVQHRFPSNQWRHYERLHDFPDGLLVLGDAVCSFNPIYGQGMTSAALQALTLKDCLEHNADPLAPAFFRAAAKQVLVAWQGSAGADLALPGVTGRASLPVRLGNRYVERVVAACEHDADVAEHFFRVISMVDAPTTLMRPGMLRKVMVPRQRSKAARTAAMSASPSPSEDVRS